MKTATFQNGINYERAVAEGDSTKVDIWSYYSLAENTISSVQIPKGWKVIVYGDERFNGKSAIYTSDVSSLGSLDNAVSLSMIEGIGN